MLFAPVHYLLQQKMQQNRADILVLSPEQYMTILQDKAAKNPALAETLRKQLAGSSFGKYWQATFNVNANQPAVIPVSQAAVDAMLITKTMQALGWAGVTTYIKSGATGSYIILKGYAAHRDAMLQGTRFADSNPKMIQMGLGMQGLKGVAKGGFLLGIVVAAGMESLDYIFNDEKTMYDLVGGIGVEAVKGGLAAAIGLAFAGTLAAAGAITTIVAVAPLILMAVVVFVAGWGLNELDARYKIKESVIAALKKVPEEASAGIYKASLVSDAEFKNWLRMRYR